ncbi:DUF3465 domain-containing protein [Algisphaera agarilytica]|uniref:DUF3465 domain-containing protein n=1 Tax=Algisphaera agarilytica TaxID=1385975 RepID=A0A7X0LK36_9BACT|nr:DUF3465 domain-containing protein [Algisphaera agarilytica]MBB6428553.1 hypothetical protein [Algisphaera agarilytica]
MPKKPSPQTMRVLKQILLLALPLIIKALKNRKAQGGSNVTVTDRTPRVEDQAPRTKARKRESAEPLPAPADIKGTTAPAKHKPSPIADLHRRKKSDVIITDTGVIVHVLPDDNEGSRHQRFLVEVDHTDITIKVAHNIDLAPRVPAREGDRLIFKGEYEYNDLGGALHWTHHDPKKWRPGGWIEHEGKRYE